MANIKDCHLFALRTIAGTQIVVVAQPTQVVVYLHEAQKKNFRERVVSSSPPSLVALWCFDKVPLTTLSANGIINKGLPRELWSKRFYPIVKNCLLLFAEELLLSFYA